VAATATLTTTGFATSPAQSAADPDCPAAADISTLTAGQPVTGKTVLRGTTPTGFTGEVVGVLEGPPDLVMVDLGADPNIGDTGIFEGMSGSPVYDADGDLIGAVAYGFAFGPSAIAGVTPASEMQKLLSDGARPAAARRTVPLPKAMARSLVADGSATTAQVTSGLHPLATQFAVSGMTAARTAQLAPMLRMGNVTPMAAPGSRTSDQEIPVETGGNMVAAMSYGDVTAGAVGTATMRCGTETVGFGHPMNFTGPATMTLHGASTVLIQKDPTLSGFKLVNIGAPVGTVDLDRSAGIHGQDTVLPPSAEVSSSAQGEVDDTTAVSHVTVPEVFSGVAVSNMFSAQDRAMDRLGGGAGTASWTVQGTYGRNHTPFELERSDMFADEFDLSGATAFAMGDQLDTLASSGERVHFDSVTTESRLDRPYETWQIGRVQMRRFGTWVTLHDGEPMTIRAGRPNYLRITLTSAQLGTRTLVRAVKPPVRVVDRIGTLRITGGAAEGGFDDFAFFDAFGFSDEPAKSVPALIKGFESAQHQNEIRATIRFRHVAGRAAQPRVRTFELARVVSGGISLPVFGIR
jgi:hypothetical protein